MLFGDEMPQRSSEWPLKVSAMTVAGPALRLITLSLKKPLVAVSILILDGAIETASAITSIKNRASRRDASRFHASLDRVPVQRPSRSDFPNFMRLSSGRWTFSKGLIVSK